MLRNKNAITLIALVITIIVLLILAGVSISVISGENGIVTKATEAAEKTENAEKEELEGLGSLEQYINDSTEKKPIYELQASNREGDGQNWVIALYNKETSKYESFGERVVIENLDSGEIMLDGDITEELDVTEEPWNYGYPDGTYIYKLDGWGSISSNCRITVYKDSIGYTWEGYIEVPR